MFGPPPDADPESDAEMELVFAPFPPGGAPVGAADRPSRLPDVPPDPLPFCLPTAVPLPVVEVLFGRPGTNESELDTAAT